MVKIISKKGPNLSLGMGTKQTLVIESLPTGFPTHPKLCVQNSFKVLNIITSCLALLINLGYFYLHIVYPFFSCLQMYEF